MKRVFLTTTLYTVLTFLLAGCGGEDSGASQQPPAATTNAPASQTSAGKAPDGLLPPAKPLDQVVTQRPESPQEKFAQIDQKLESLSRELADIRRQLARGGTAEQSPAGASRPRNDDQARPGADSVETQRLAALESDFRVEPVDAAWSRSASDSVRAAVTGDEASGGEYVRSIECRSNTCKVVADLAGARAAGKNPSLLLARLGQTLPKVNGGRMDSADGAETAVLYLSR